ncbi:hypothetical protein HRbin39_01300 [bacterium HR39]|nr:hypothetical protein HRbin39_01300 [bacterium HR39]
MRIAGRPVRIAEIPTAGTDLPALTRPAVLRLVHCRLAPGLSCAESVRTLAGDPEARAAFTEALASPGAQPPSGGPRSRR